MMQYACKLEPNGEDGFVATFPDVPDALTEGASREEALANAADALEVALLGRMKDGDDIPVAAKVRRGVLVYVPAQSAAKIAFYVAFRESGLSRSALARKIGKDEAEVRRMLDPYHATKLQPLEEALLALGRRLVVDVKAA
jgi:antitoxin HicB